MTHDEDNTKKSRKIEVIDSNVEDDMEGTSEGASPDPTVIAEGSGEGGRCSGRRR